MPWRVTVVLVLVGPVLALGMFTALAYSTLPEVKPWSEWMAVFEIAEVADIVGLASLQLMDFMSAYAKGKPKKGTPLTAFAQERVVMGWFLPGILCFFPGDMASPPSMLPWLQAHVPSLAMQLSQSTYLQRRAMLAACSALFVAVLPVAALLTPLEWARARYFAGEGQDEREIVLEGEDNLEVRVGPEMVTLQTQATRAGGEQMV